MNKEKKVFFNNERKARVIPTLVIALALPFMLFIVSPLEVYKNGINEFLFSLFDFFWVLIIVSIIASIIIFAVLLSIPKIVYRLFYVFAIASLFMIFIQMNFLNGNLTSLSGDGLNQKVKTSAKIFNILIWVVCYVGFYLFFFLTKKRDIKAIICLMLSFGLLASQFLNMFILGANIIKSDDTSLYALKIKEDENYKPTFLTSKNLTNVSKNHNVIIFCVDRFDGLEYAEPSMKEYPEIYQKLNGFTYYKDATSMYSNTYPSVAYMLTNIEKTENDRKQYLNNAYKNNKTLSNLASNNYDINLYTENYYSYYDAFNLPSYISNKEDTTKENVKTSITFLNKIYMALRFVQVSFYRTLPIVMKDFCGKVSSTTCNDYVDIKAENLGNDIYSTDMKDVYNAIANNDFEQIDRNNFSFIHFTGCHSIEYSEQWESTVSKDINISIKNSFNIINTYLDKIKLLENGEEIYKNSTIIITGDHSNIHSDYVELDGERLTAFFYKPAGEDSGNPLINISEKPISHEDMWKTIFASENISSFDSECIKGYDITKEVPMDRERHYYLTTENRVHSEYDHLFYSIKGSGRAFNNWQLDNNKSVHVNQYLYD